MFEHLARLHQFLTQRAAQAAAPTPGDYDILAAKDYLLELSDELRTKQLRAYGYDWSPRLESSLERQARTDGDAAAVLDLIRAHRHIRTLLRYNDFTLAAKLCASLDESRPCPEVLKEIYDVLVGFCASSESRTGA